MKQHKWHKEIKAWADGEEIEVSRQGMNDWHLIGNDHDWSGNLFEYRIKPQPKEPKYLYVYEDCPVLLSLGLNSEYKNKLVGKIKLEQDDETL